MKSILIVLLLFVVNILKSQTELWMPSNGPYACSVSSFMNDSLSNIIILEDSILFLSTDFGETWNRTGNCYGNPVMDKKGNIYYSGTISNDFGKTWKSILKQYYGFEIRGMGICKNNNVIAYTYEYPGGKGTIWISIDNGISWTEHTLNNSDSDEFINIFCSNDSGYVFGISTFLGKLWRSTNNGSTWYQLNINFGINTIRCISAKNDGNLFVGTIGGIFHSTDYGNTWLPAELSSETINCLYISNEGEIYAGTSENGIYKSVNNGYNWFAVNNEIKLFEIITLGSVANKLFAGTKGNGLYNSINSGQNWNLSKEVPKTVCTSCTGSAETGISVK
jgi:photosystem II stability/assembly factor-like uncharacterized protein